MAISYVTFTDVVREYHSGTVTVRAADGISFGLDKGRFSMIVGPSGAGKTTVLNILGGMDSATSGSVVVDDREISRLSKREICTYRRNDVGFVFQFYNLIPNLTALENIKLAAELSANPIPPTELLHAIGLADRATSFPTQLSGGQQQRIAIARAVTKNPFILLCDEPTGALDHTTGIQILRLLKDFNQNYKKTVVIITHNAQIGEMGNRVFHIKDGLIDKIDKINKPIEPEDIDS